MKRLTTTLAVLAAAGFAMRAFAAPPGKAITGSKHDFITTAYVDSNGNTLYARNKCGTCHGAHKVLKNKALWSRVNPSSTTWTVWNGAAGQALDGSQGASYLSAEDFVASGTGMCMSCHDGQTAIGKTQTGGISVYMKTTYRGNWGRNLSDMHPVGKNVPFGTPGWHPDLATGNTAAGSNVAVETNGTVGCTSCHSMHSSENSSKILRGGERCMACHDR